MSRLLPLHFLRSRLLLQPPTSCLREFSTSIFALSGHSRWSKIKHDKGKNDARRGLNFSRISQEISFSSRDGGAGSDNLRLNAAIAAAKKAGMPKDRIAAAVARGQGVSPTGAQLDPMLIECMGPGSVAMMVTGMTDNTRRTLQAVREILSKNGATQTPTSYMFAKKGIVRVAGSIDEIMESALEIDGTEDVIEDEDEGMVQVITDPTRLSVVAEGIKDTLASVRICSAGIEWVPNEDTMVELAEAGDSDALDNLVEKLEECQDVGEIYTNLK